MLSKDVEFPVTSDKTDEGDCPVRNVVKCRQFEFCRWPDRSKPLFLDELQRCFTFEAAIAMIPVVEELKVLGLRPEMAIAPKPLSSEEFSVVGIIEAFHHSITPRFSCGDEDDFDPQQQTEPQNDAKGARVTIASPETEFVVDLKKVWNPHGPPTAKQTQSHGLIVFPSLGVEKDSVTAKIDDIEGIETSIVLDVPGSHEIRLMDMVDSQRLSEIGVFDPFGEIRSFF
jgi:hypothetical protein